MNKHNLEIVKYTTYSIKRTVDDDNEPSGKLILSIDARVYQVRQGKFLAHLVHPRTGMTSTTEFLGFAETEDAALLVLIDKIGDKHFDDCGL